MQIVFASNFLNHHQVALTDALWRQTGGNFLFVAAEELPQERKQLGYPVVERPYVCALAEEPERVRAAIRQADAVILGSAPEWLARERIRCGKLLLRYSERPLRGGREWIKYLPRLVRWHWRNPPGKPIYLLCAGAFTGKDYRKFGLFRGRCFQWGYFPERKEYDLAALFAGKNAGDILWCGRFLELKRPMDALAAAEKLKAEGFSFHLKFLGTGPLEAELREQIRRRGLEEQVAVLGPRTPEEVRRIMETCGIFLFTSDKREGWGAVLNEAMNSGCAVVASHAVGSVPWLIRGGETGMVYPCGDVEALTQCVRELLRSPQYQRRLGEGAYKRIRDVWEPETAARRLIALIRRLERGEDPAIFSDGPCAPAEEMGEDWLV